MNASSIFDSFDDVDIVCVMRFGSHLYGTDTEDSDLDYKGVYIPSLEDVLLGKYRKSLRFSTGDNKDKNTSEDIDIELYSLQYFIKLLCEGQTVALDMVHASSIHMVLPHLQIWEQIVANRSRVYSKNMKAFVGYAQKQAAKYGIKGSRLAEVKTVMNHLTGSLVRILARNPHAENNLDSVAKKVKLNTVWDWLKTAKWEHCEFKLINDNEYFVVCGIALQGTGSVGTALVPLKNYEKKYGERARQAEKNQGVDWKAISHAFRAAFQLVEIYKDPKHGYSYPLKQAEFLKDVKAGKHDYKEVSEELESLIEKVKVMAEESDLPEKVDTTWWTQFTVSSLKTFYRYQFQNYV